MVKNQEKGNLTPTLQNQFRCHFSLRNVLEPIENNDKSLSEILTLF